MKKSEEKIYSLLNIIGETIPDRPSRVKNPPRYMEAKRAILKIADVIWDADENANVNIVEEMGTAISLHVESALISTDQLEKLCTSLTKANRVELFPVAGNIGLVVIFDGVFVSQSPNHPNHSNHSNQHNQHK